MRGWYRERSESSATSVVWVGGVRCGRSHRRRISPTCRLHRSGRMRSQEARQSDNRFGVIRLSRTGRRLFRPRRKCRHVSSSTASSSAPCASPSWRPPVKGSRVAKGHRRYRHDRTGFGAIPNGVLCHHRLLAGRTVPTGLANKGLSHDALLPFNESTTPSGR